ncbi:vesicle-associated protein 2-2-like isoform X2 [Magnolia sinica]|uniref:vesicle-associated protein 2-2-like isoform X2 n=1 Tax=Magnolia sinica TaxID=86752 RepID=UPI002658EA7C|nr:vesicle-associated protein 2-2-like isoform X2 [Magnolia sinica]XP_058077769.1 vesicle-associated protein 2-2-like isoform X2 [Magnolia sinica]
MFVLCATFQFLGPVCCFQVTMQAQREAPPDMQCKDKFLIQSTIVPFGTTPEDIKPTHFTKENGRYIEENKLKVVLVSPPHSPVLLPINGVSKQVPAYEAPILKQEPILKDELSIGVENLPPSHVVVPKDVDVSKDVEELNLKLNELESQLNEAEKTIARLREERSTTIQEKDMLKQELALATRKSGVRRVRVGFPFLFVCFIALVSMTLGYKLRM